MKRVFVSICVTFVALFWTGLSVNAQQMSLLAGPIFKGGDTSLSAQAEYFQQLRGPTYFSIAYLNRGHFNDDHDDGFAGQLWFGKKYGNFFFAAGAGPYLFYDTKKDKDIVHGVGLITAVKAQYSLSKNFAVIVQPTFVTTKELTTFAPLVGIAGSLPQLKAGNGRKNEIAVFGGVSILNRGGGDRDSVGYAVEYRRDIADYVQWSVAFLDEGKKGNMERRGGATQLWLAGHFGDKLSLGLGGGYYLAHDDYRNTWENDFIVSATAAYPVSNRLNIRFSFDRIAAPRDGDADLIRVGIGYRF